jgi:hypothetical protein
VILVVISALQVFDYGKKLRSVDINYRDGGKKK